MFDITLKSNKLFLRFEPGFFEENFQAKWCAPHEEYGEFRYGKTLGFTERITLLSRSKTSIVYQWIFPEPIQQNCSCNGFFPHSPCPRCNDQGFIFRPSEEELFRLYETIHHLFNVPFEYRFFSDPTLVPKQSFSLCEVARRANGWIYPPLLSFLKNSTLELREEMNAYVNKEIGRMHAYVWGKPDLIQTKIGKTVFAFEIPGSETRFTMDSTDMTYRNMHGFSNHNAHSSIERFSLTMGIIAMNTFFRDHEEKIYTEEKQE